MFRKKEELMQTTRDFLSQFTLPSRVWNKHGVPNTSSKASATDQISAQKILSFPKVRVDQIQPIWNDHDDIEFEVDKRIKSHIEVECQYAHYVKQQESMAAQMASREQTLDISSLDYQSLRGVVSTEDIERLETKKPQTIQAAVRAGLK